MPVDTTPMPAGPNLKPATPIIPVLTTRVLYDNQHNVSWFIVLLLVGGQHQQARGGARDTHGVHPKGRAHPGCPTQRLQGPMNIQENKILTSAAIQMSSYKLQVKR